MSARRSWRTVSLRYEASHASVLSTTHLCHPNLLLEPLPLLALRTLIRRRWRACRQKGKSYPLSACSFSGRLRGLPLGPLTAGTESNNSSKSLPVVDISAGDQHREG
jgi:hypothetical protein